MNNEEFWNICGLLDSSSQEDRILGMNILEALGYPYREFLEMKLFIENSNIRYIDIPPPYTVTWTN